ncbi:MAG: GTP cyclohydrolase II [Rectinemataceae bacterium]|jgi:GTP cyclohydrolase II
MIDVANGKITRECLTEDCGKTVDLAELKAKLSEDPGFPTTERYCVGAGKYCKDDDFCVQLVAHAHLPSRFGEFELYGFYDAREDKEHTAMVHGDVAGKKSVVVRVHSECHTGDVLGSLRCDCRDQLEASLRFVASQECGAVIYLRQEGRGIGLLNKIKAYRLQELGLDTVEANIYLGFPDEARDYKVAAKILALLKIESLKLLTNNPDKITKLEAEGVVVEGRLPLVIAPNPYDADYLSVKREKMGHLF